MSEIEKLIKEYADAKEHYAEACEECTAAINRRDAAYQLYSRASTALD